MFDAFEKTHCRLAKDKTDVQGHKKPKTAFMKLNDFQNTSSRAAAARTDDGFNC